jgi:hypothetical protein
MALLLLPLFGGFFLVEFSFEPDNADTAALMNMDMVMHSCS